MANIRVILIAALAVGLSWPASDATAQARRARGKNLPTLAARDFFYERAGGPYGPSEVWRDGPPVRLNEGDLPGIRSYVEHVMEQWQIPGLALAIVQDGETFLVEGFGVRNMATGAPVDGDTLFNIASMTKAFTTTAMAMLVQDGLLAWDEPVLDYYPAFQLQDPDLMQQMLLRDIVTHRTGFDGAPVDHELIGKGGPEFYTRYEIAARLADFPAAFPIRARYSYCSSFYVLAGVVMEEVTGKTWDEIVHERIFEPLGMTRSRTAYYDWPDSNYARGYYVRRGRVRPIEIWTTQNVAPSAGVHSTAADMAKWMSFHLGRGTYAGEEILGAEYVENMHDAHMAVPDAAFKLKVAFNNADAMWVTAYGLGWDIAEYQGKKIVWHNGCWFGAKSVIYLIPSDGFGVVVLTNLATSGQCQKSPETLGMRIIDAYLGRPERDWSGEFYDYFMGD